MDVLQISELNHIFNGFLGDLMQCALVLCNKFFLPHHLKALWKIQMTRLANQFVNIILDPFEIT